MVVRTDTNGAYLWTGSQWVQLVTASSMPAAFDFSGDGCYEIQVAPSNSSIMYMTFAGYVFKSTNKGTTWTQTAFAGFNNSKDPANDSRRMNGQKMAIDPNNPNIVYVGPPRTACMSHQRRQHLEQRKRNPGCGWRRHHRHPV